ASDFDLQNQLTHTMLVRDAINAQSLISIETDFNPAKAVGGGPRPRNTNLPGWSNVDSNSPSGFLNLTLSGAGGVAGHSAGDSDFLAVQGGLPPVSLRTGGARGAGNDSITTLMKSQAAGAQGGAAKGGAQARKSKLLNRLLHLYAGGATSKEKAKLA